MLGRSWIERRSVRRGHPPRLVRRPLEPGAWEVVPPPSVVSAARLGMNEAIDRLVADDLVAGLAGKTTTDLLGRPAVGKTIEDRLAERIVALQSCTRPTPGIGLLLGITRSIADLGTAVALQLAGDRRRLAIQSCSNLPDRLPGFAKPGNRTPFLER